MTALIEAKAKAIAAAVVGAAAAYLLTALTTGTAATLHGLEVAAGTAALAFLGVHQAPKNKERRKKAKDAGVTALEVLVIVVLILVVLILLGYGVRH